MFLSKFNPRANAGGTDQKNQTNEASAILLFRLRGVKRMRKIKPIDKDDPRNHTKSHERKPFLLRVISWIVDLSSKGGGVGNSTTPGLRSCGSVLSFAGKGIAQSTNLRSMIVGVGGVDREPVFHAIRATL